PRSRYTLRSPVRTPDACRVVGVSGGRSASANCRAAAPEFAWPSKASAGGSTIRGSRHQRRQNDLAWQGEMCRDVCRGVLGCCWQRMVDAAAVTEALEVPRLVVAGEAPHVPVDDTADDDAIEEQAA